MDTSRTRSASFDTLLPVETTGPAETEALGGRLAGLLRPGDIVALYGDLGAGKTRLVQGICAALGIAPEAVSSPTFTLVNDYEGRTDPVDHLDAYRIRHIDEFYEMGYEEYFFGDGLCLVEWPERVEGLLPPDALRLRLRHLGADRREIELVE
jgi:tRNA threonylcarbamoyladenosine biosynthesis protein TsaE